jgi:hypothetical protein
MVTGVDTLIWPLDAQAKVVVVALCALSKEWVWCCPCSAHAGASWPDRGHRRLWERTVMRKLWETPKWLLLESPTWSECLPNAQHFDIFQQWLQCPLSPLWYLSNSAPSAVPRGASWISPGGDAKRSSARQEAPRVVGSASPTTAVLRWDVSKATNDVKPQPISTDPIGWLQHDGKSCRPATRLHCFLTLILTSTYVNMFQQFSTGSTCHTQHNHYHLLTPKTAPTITPQPKLRPEIRQFLRSHLRNRFSLRRSSAQKPRKQQVNISEP